MLNSFVAVALAGLMPLAAASDEMVRVCLEGDAVKVRALMSQGADLSQLSKEAPAMSPLLALCLSSKMPKSEKMAFLHAFLAAGVDINQRSLAGSTPLAAVASIGDVDLACFLIKHGADVNALDEYGISPLMAALSAEHIEMARLLLAHGADSHHRAMSCTLLHLAVAGGSLKVLQFLLSLEGELKLNIQLKSADGQTALDLAREMKQEEMVKLLLQYGADAP